MFELLSWPTPNGLKVRLFLEETGLPYRERPIDIGRGAQHAPEFLAVSPNHKIPVLIDHAPADGGPALTVFESGAILLYLAQRSGQLWPTALRLQTEVMQWLCWQVAGLGPMAGQAGHFRVHAPEPVPYAITRYTRETARLYGVLDRHLATRTWIVGEQISIADLACYPWIVPHAGLGQDLQAFPHLARWFAAIGARPATQRSYAGVRDPYTGAPALSATERAVLFGASSSPI